MSYFNPQYFLRKGVYYAFLCRAIALILNGDIDFFIVLYSHELNETAIYRKWRKFIFQKKKIAQVSVVTLINGIVSKKWFKMMNFSSLRLFLF